MNHVIILLAGTTMRTHKSMQECITYIFLEKNGSVVKKLTSDWNRLGSIEYIVSRDEKGVLHAFHNVCRHHASLLVAGTGKKSCFACPYHVSLWEHKNLSLVA